MRDTYVLRANSLVDKLQDLGLTASEGKAYLAIVKLGLCTAVQIASRSELQRTEIYRLVRGLVSLGLVEETLDRPKRFRASNIQDAILDLTEKSLARLTNLSHQSKRLIAKLEALAPMLDGRRKEPEVHVTTGVNNIRRNFLEMLTSAQHEIWTISARERILVPERATPKVLGIITSRHLKVRAVLQVDERNLKPVKRIASTVEVRHHDSLGVHLYGVDNRFAAVGLTAPTETSLHKIAQIETSYPSYVRIMGRFFDLIWKESIPLDQRLQEFGHGKRCDTSRKD